MRYFKICFMVLLFGGGVVGNTGAATAPDFTLVDLDGKQVNLQKLLEMGPVLVDFWATYCKPCLKAMPQFEKMHHTYSERGLTILGVNEDGPRGIVKVRPFLKKLQISYRNVIDGDGSLLHRFGASGCPTAFLIAPDGQVVLKQAGYIPRYHDEMIEAIEMQLSKSDDLSSQKSDSDQ